jgi:NAD(P)-dependent dehydrogenase (short-subunit alcohol dehydrogenase family)
MHIPSLAGRTIAITGATGGIGRVAAVELARAGAEVVLLVRDRSRAEATVAEIRAGSPSANVSYRLGDLALLADVRRLATELASDHPKLHVLLNNAGAYFASRELTSEGIERTWALNVLSPLLLSHLLVDRLRAGAPARIVNVASAAHKGQTLDFTDLEASRSYSGFRVYGRSKLALIMMTYELARRLEGSGITVNALHPGFVATGFGRNNPGATGRVLAALEFLFARRPAHGARTSVYLAGSPEVEGISGRYFADERPIRSSAASLDPAARARLWPLLCARAGIAPDTLPPPPVRPEAPGPPTNLTRPASG